MCKIALDNWIPIFAQLDWKVIGFVEIFFWKLLRNGFHLRILNIHTLFSMDSGREISSISIFSFWIPFLASHFYFFLRGQIKELTNFREHFLKLLCAYMMVGDCKKTHLSASFINSPYSLLAFFRVIILLEQTGNIYFRNKSLIFHFILLLDIFFY